MARPTKKAVIEASQPSPSHPHVSPPSSTLIIRFDDDEREMFMVLEKNLDRICAAIDLQTEVLKGMRKDNNERR